MTEFARPIPAGVPLNFFELRRGCRQWLAKKYKTFHPYRDWFQASRSPRMIRIATRGSALALAQAGQVAELLGGAELVEVSSDGEPGDKARFVRGVERALLDGRRRHRRPLGQGPAGRAARGAGDRRGAAARGPGRRLDRRRRLARRGRRGRPGRHREPAAPRAAARRAPGPAGRASCTATSTPGCAGCEEGELDAIVLAAAGLRRLGRAAEVSFSIAAETMTPAAGPGRARPPGSRPATRRPKRRRRRSARSARCSS